jgi:cell division protein FtsB
MTGGFILGLAWRFATSRVGILVIAALALLAWHKFDKGSAVRQAVTGYVAKVELETLRAERDELRRRRAAVSLANQTLQSKIEQAEADADAARVELQDYVSTVDDTCRVNDPLIDRLRHR